MTTTLNEPALPAGGTFDARQLRRAEKNWNFVTALFFVFTGFLAVLLMITLLAGDWNFWTDWKDRVYWPLMTAPVAIFALALVQYVGWRLLRVPFASVLAVLFMAVWMLQSAYGFNILGPYPINFTWPATIIPVALLLDVVLVLSRGKWLWTALIGAFAFGALFYISNHVLLAPFLQPVEREGRLITVANLQGFAYHRSATPEYLAKVGVGGLHSFAGQLNTITAMFTGTLCVAAYGLGLGTGRLIVVWPMNRFMKKRG